MSKRTRNQNRARNPGSEEESPYSTLEQKKNENVGPQRFPPRRPAAQPLFPGHPVSFWRPRFRESRRRVRPKGFRRLCSLRSRWTPWHVPTGSPRHRFARISNRRRDSFSRSPQGLVSRYPRSDHPVAILSGRERSSQDSRSRLLLPILSGNRHSRSTAVLLRHRGTFGSS